MPQALNKQQIDAAIGGELKGWSVEDDKLVRKFEFGSFKEAMSFLVRVAFEAEARDHHPEVHNVYKWVTLSLSTHDAGGKVTSKDVDLAKAIQAIDWTRHD
ncbi:MAG: 4a-hydroxytetrahydrobiopterin dehydratase [Phycisphaeraceae bacterium]